MTYTRPFRTPLFTAYAGDSQTRVLSLALSVTDTFTRVPVAVKLRVQLKERRWARVIVNPSGFICFEELPNGNYTLITEPDPVTADWYFLQPSPGQAWPSNFESPVAIPVPGPNTPLVQISLAPNPSYPFPAVATLVRGRITQNAGRNPAVAAVVSANYLQTDPQDPANTIPASVASKSDNTGEYVLFFQQLPQPGQAVAVTARFTGQQLARNIQIQEGKTVSVPFAFP